MYSFPDTIPRAMKQAALRTSKIYNENLPQMNTVLKMYRALFLHSKCIIIKHEVMIMKRRKKKRRKMMELKKCPPFWLKGKQTIGLESAF